MPFVSGGDGARIHWEEQGEGPLVVLAGHVFGHPSIFEPLTADLVADHRVVIFHARGTGQSSRQGPHDLDTGAEDLAAVIEAAGGPAVLLGLADAANRAVRVAARRPELVVAVVGVASAPISRRELAGAEAMLGSETVVNAFQEQLETDYRGALRSLMTMANPQMSEDEVRERVQRQVAYCPRETAVPRVRAWALDDAADEGRDVGDRLWLLSSENMAGPWFPPLPELRALMSRLLPEARQIDIEDGIISRPDLTAGVVRKITARIPAAR
jgi:pimeloyl-ACP methyl ester carboxylesterase